VTPLRYPTIDLFLYDLQDGLGVSPMTTDQNRHRFWQRIYGDKISDEKLAALKTKEKSFSSYIELLGSQPTQQLAEAIDGYYYPVKLGDTYALQIDCSGRLNDSEWDQLSFPVKLQQIREIVLQYTHHIRGDLGENWLIWGQLGDANQTAEAIAQECYQSVQLVETSNWQNDYKGSGSFKGATLFEVEQLDYTPDGANQTIHGIICLFPHHQSELEIQDTIGKLYLTLIRLFHYRNKVLWVYEQSRQLKTSLKTSSQTIEKIIKSLGHQIQTSHLNLNQLQNDLTEALSISHYYETLLGDLKEQVATITINTDNYNACLESLKALDSQSDLKFLQRFGEFARKQCLTQIQTDDVAFTAGLKPLENFIKTVEGITDIEKTKNERTFNRTVAIASVGISTASLAASTFNSQSDQLVKLWFPIPANKPTPAFNLWFSFLLSFLLSVAVGLLGATITWLFLGKRGRT
jgi:hypothetical protein